MSDAAPQSPAQPGRLRTWILLGLILIAALGIRLMSFTEEAVWYDELMVVEHLDSPSVAEFLRNALPRTPVPPAFMISEYLWSRVAGTETAALRTWPLICGIAGLAVCFVLTRRLLGTQVALIAVLWLSLLYWHFHLSQEIRYYALASLLSLLSMWAFAELVAAPRAAGWFAIHLLFNAAMVWTHPITVFLCAAQLAFLWLFRRERRRLIAVWIGGHLAIGATLYAFLASLDQEAAFAQAAWISRPTIFGPPPSLRYMVYMFSGIITLSPTNSWGEKYYALEPYSATALILMHGILGFLGARYLKRTPAAEQAPHLLSSRETRALLLLWLILPPMLVFVASYVWKPMFVVRYVLFASIPLYIFIAQALVVRPKWVAAIAFALLFTHDALFYFPGPTRTPFDQLADTIQRQSAAPPIIYLDDMLGQPVILHYWDSDVQPTFKNFIQRDEVMTAEKRPTGVELWAVFTDAKRFENFQEALVERGIAADAGKYKSSKPLWLVHLHP